MTPRLVLRFRDFNVNTIEEHTKIIDAKGSVWWGWWKKNLEPEQENALNLIKSSLDQVSNLKIALANREQSRYYEAKLTNLRFKDAESVESPDPTMTPSYYKDEKCPSWFCFSEIVEIPRSLFETNYGVLPASEDTLFLNLPKNTKERVRPIKAFGNGILHISDLHFGTDFEYSKQAAPQLPKADLLDILTEDIEKLGVRVGILIVSGDLTTKSDYLPLQTDAFHFLNSLTDKLGITKSHTIVIPGNHDIPLDKAKPLDYSHEELFLKFLTDFYQAKCSSIIRAVEFELPNKTYLQILAMNSVKLRSDATREYGYVGWQNYKDYLASLTPRKKILRIAVLHHHLVPAPTIEYPDASIIPVPTSLTLDAGEVIQGLQLNGFRLALHGHQHVPAITKVARGYPEVGSGKIHGLDRSVYVIASGSTGSKRLTDQMRNNTYTLIEQKRDKVYVRIRQFSRGRKPFDCLTYSFKA